MNGGESRFEWTAEELRTVGHQVVDLVVEHLTGLRDEPVFRPVPRTVVRGFETEAVPQDGAPVDAVLGEFAARVEPWPFGNGHPRFYGWVNPPPHPLGVFAELLAAAMNPSVAGGNHAAVHVERQVVRWFAELAGLPGTAHGLLVSGGSAATLTGLAVARHRAALRAGRPVREDGVQAGAGGPAAARFVVYQGAEGHGSARKAAELLGIGSGNVRVVGSDDGHRIRVPALRDAIAADVRAGHVPVAVLASAGTVNTGAVDDLAAIADVCAGFGVWLHVDAAYGGPAVLLLPRFAAVRAALGRADSVALDPHKWLYAPVDAGLVLFRDGAPARDAFSLVPPYLRTDDDPAGVGGPVWFSEYGFEQTRPFRALKVWMLLKHLGVRGYRELIEHDLAVADRIAAAVAAAPELQLLARGLSVVCFRCRPPGGPGGEELDELNRRVLRAVQLGGGAFLAGTTVDGVFALRACVVNPRATAGDADALVAQVRAGLAADGAPDRAGRADQAGEAR
ncbi:pyridoxal-dependent decarboxylase [Dactylosporangium sp. NPDC049140]|jgi:glutamate/tyrosine decarboxylase-like PLP-dependent enzyme|uniref:pyridoxal phosphate-dependent decarboxylase family protein n=1 Tax=Dactylosporangium sp. NPDC049140 TaxID=3155647 RepID=UPI0033F40F42